MTTPTYDLALIPARPTMKFSAFGVQSFVKHLAGHHCILRPNEQRRNDWRVYTAGPGAFASAIFDHVASELPHFRALTIGWGASAHQLDFPDAPVVFFYLRIEQTSFTEVGQGFLERMQQILRCHPRLLMRPSV